MKQSEAAILSDQEPRARPLLKWCGGKTVLLPEILPRLPKKIGTYYEPFVGGGAVFFALAAEGRFRQTVLGDMNRELIVTYGAIRNELDEVLRLLKAHAAKHSEEYFYKVRAQTMPSDPKSNLSAYVAARFVYLNRTCFNGLYRVNRRGLFNVPFGRYANPMICDEENLRAVALVLPRVVLASIDFQNMTLAAKRGDAVYFDPPYVPLSATSNFVAYAKEGFGPTEQERLRDVARNMVARGVHVLLSNSDTPLVWELYGGSCFKIEVVEAPRRVNSKVEKRGNVKELLISGRNV